MSSVKDWFEVDDIEKIIKNIFIQIEELKL